MYLYIMYLYIFLYASCLHRGWEDNNLICAIRHICINTHLTINLTWLRCSDAPKAEFIFLYHLRLRQSVQVSIWHTPTPFDTSSPSVDMFAPPTSSSLREARRRRKLVGEVSDELCDEEISSFNVGPQLFKGQTFPVICDGWWREFHLLGEAGLSALDYLLRVSEMIKQKLL